MKKDTLKRDLPDNSLVVVRGKDGEGKASMNHGILIGKSVYTQFGHQSASNEMVLVKLPYDDTETAIYKEIMSRLNAQQNTSTKNKKQRALRVADQPGVIYKTKQGTCCQDYYLYCGHKQVTIYEDSKIVSQETGHVYLTSYENVDSARTLTLQDFITDGTNALLTHESYRDDFKARKKPKNYNEQLHRLDVPATIEMTGSYTFNSVLDRTVVRKVVIEDL